MVALPFSERIWSALALRRVLLHKRSIGRSWFDYVPQPGDRFHARPAELLLWLLMT